MTGKTVVIMLTVTRTFPVRRRICPVIRWFLSVLIFEKILRRTKKMLGIYENDIRESIGNGAWLSSLRDCNFSSEWSRLICEAGRWCESYASDLMIDMDSVRAYLIGMAEG